ncbi:MAG: sec-independent protein translocase protein TatA [Natronomonas sp.]|jgi:sec-independent protein translocase protein TatA|uniref:twin-arginine translocase TatA/TatE family subunit n=1 Tax=Natronomonas sp. TaxID=2184060 RepID=UPI0039E30E46
MIDLLPLQFGLPGGPELLIILLIAVLLFGANKIPELARSTGEAMGEFQKGREEVEQELQDMRDPSSSDASEATEIESEATEPETEADSEQTAEPENEEFEIADAEPENETN